MNRKLGGSQSWSGLFEDRKISCKSWSICCDRTMKFSRADSRVKMWRFSDVGLTHVQGVALKQHTVDWDGVSPWKVRKPSYLDAAVYPVTFHWEKSLASTVVRTPDRPARGLLFIPTALHRLPNIININQKLSLPLIWGFAYNRLALPNLKITWHSFRLGKCWILLNSIMVIFF